MEIFSALIFLLTSHSATSVRMVTPSNTEDGKHVCFPNKVDGLPWPITSGWNLENEVVHGTHCISVLMHQVSDLVSHMHKQHCWDHLQKVMQILEHQPEFRLPEVVCKEIRKTLQHNFPSRDGGGGRRMRRSTQSASTRFFSVDFVMPKFNFDPDVAGSTSTSTPLGRKKRDAEDPEAVEASHQMYERLKAMAKGPGELFQMIGSFNTGSFQFLEEDEKTDAEREHIKEWKRPELSAVGLFCMVSDYENPMEDLKAVMKSLKKP